MRGRKNSSEEKKKKERHGLEAGLISILATASSSSAVRGMRLLDEVVLAALVAVGALAGDLPFEAAAADDLPLNEVTVAAAVGFVQSFLEVPLVEGSSRGLVEVDGLLFLTSGGGGDSEEERPESPFIAIASRSISTSAG